MKYRLWAIHAVLILFFSGVYVFYSFGSRGLLRHPYLHNNIYPTLQRVSVFFSDLKLRLRGPVPVKSKIAILEFDSESLELYGRWPWSRNKIAEVIERTFEAGARVVGLDMVFSEPQVSVPEELSEILRKKNMGGMLKSFDYDGDLASTVRRHSDRLALIWVSENPCQPAMSNPEECPVTDPKALSLLPKWIEPFQFGAVRYAKKFDPGRTPIVSAGNVIANIERISEAASHTGCANSFRDADGMVRRTSLVAMVGGQPHPNIALELAAIAKRETLAIALDDSGGVASLGFSKSRQEIPVSSSGIINLNLRGPSGTFPSVPVWKLIDAVGDDGVVRETADIAPLKNAIVLIGISALAVSDVAATPFDRVIPGVELQATVLDNILAGDMLKTEGSRWGFFAVLFLMSFGGVFLSRVTHHMGGRQTILGFALALFTVAFWDSKVLFAANIDVCTAFLYLEWFSVVGTSLVSKYLREERNKNYLRNAFSKYVAPAIVDSIVSNPSSLSLGGRKAPATVFFSDLRGFTSFAEKIDGSQLVDYLNEYFTLMTDVLFSHRGTLDKFIGDSVMAFWGAPLTQPDHASRACQAAVAMVREISKHRDRLKEKYGYETRMGIGIHSSVVTVGNLGSEKNVNFTVIGDGVNLASRLQSATKMFGAEILTSRETLDGIRELGHELPAYRLLGEVWLKGKAKPIEVAEILAEPLSAQQMAAFDAARELFNAGKWAEAVAKFNEAGGDPVCQAFQKRCQEYQKNPPNSVNPSAWVMAA